MIKCKIQFAKHFIQFAKQECKNYTPLYEYLSFQIAKDEMLAANYLIKNKRLLEFIEGDGVQLLSTITYNIPKNFTLCIFHTHVANQMPKEVRENLLLTIKKIGHQRDVFHLYNNISDSHLHLDYYINGIEYTSTIAETDAHGRWFKWLTN